MHQGFHWWDLWGEKKTHTVSLYSTWDAVPPYCNFLFESYLEQPGTVLQQIASHSRLCSPAAASTSTSPSFSFSLHSRFHPPSLYCLCNVMISMLRTSKALPGHQSLRRSVSCLTVSQSVDQSLGSHSCWITHSIARLIAQPLTHSLTHLFIYFLFVYFYFYSGVLPMKQAHRGHLETDILDWTEPISLLFIYFSGSHWRTTLSSYLPSHWTAGSPGQGVTKPRVMAMYQQKDEVEGSLFLLTVTLKSCALNICTETE